MEWHSRFYKNHETCDIKKNRFNILKFSFKYKNKGSEAESAEIRNGITGAKCNMKYSTEKG